MTTWFNVLQTRTTVSLSANGLLQLVCTTVLESFFIAYYLFLTWDAPFVNLVKLVTAGSKEGTEKVKLNSFESNKLTTENDNATALTVQTEVNGV